MPPAGAAGVNEVCRRPPRIQHPVARIRCARRHPEKSPGGAALTGATGTCGRIARLSVTPAGAIPRWRCAYRGYRGVRSDCPAKRRAIRRNPRWRCAYRGYRACGRIARLSVAPAGAIPRWRCAYRGYRGVRSGCPAKRRASRGDPGRRVTPPARTAA